MSSVNRNPPGAASLGASDPTRKCGLGPLEEVAAAAYCRRMGALVIVAALGLAVFMWWLRILVTLLREGPSVGSDGWLASVIVVTVLGPLGALIYLATRPDRRARVPRP